jgi:hypothetical protein
MMVLVMLPARAASAACTYPQGFVGSSVYEMGFITSWTRNPTPDAHGKYSKFDVTYTYTDPQYGSISGPVDFGDNNVNIQGPGWTGAKILTTRMAPTQTLGSHSDPTVCDYGGSIICWIINENTNAFRFDTSQSGAVIVLGTGFSSTGYHGTGLTKIRGMGLSGDPKTMYLYSFNSSHVVSYKTASMTTTGCTAALDILRDWRLAFAAPKNPDALTIETLLFG